MGDRLAEMGISVNQDLSALPPEWADTLKTGFEQATAESFRSSLRGAVKESVTGSVRLELDRSRSANLRAGGGGAYDLGVSVGQGIESGLNASKGRVGRAASNLANEVAKQTRFTLQINSPSKVMRELGRGAGDGMVLGLHDRERDVVNATRAMVGQMPTAASMAAQSVSAPPSAAPTFTGRLYLDSGEFVGMVRGVADDAVRDGKGSTAAAVAGGVVH